MPKASLQRSINEFKLSKECTVLFVSKEKGEKYLGTLDGFVARMSSFERALRMNKKEPVAEDEFLMFVQENVLDWTDDELVNLHDALLTIKWRLFPYTRILPATISFIKTTGKEEFNAPYTRGNALILPLTKLNLSTIHLGRLIVHEFFHILSRNDPGLRDSLYSIIGFLPCGNIEIPQSLKPRKLTNPDAPENAHYINLYANGQRLGVVLILLARENFNLNQFENILTNIILKFLAIEETKQGWKPIFQDGQPVLFDLGMLKGFFENVGQNTKYIIHPEEILADNFMILVMGDKNLPSPHIVEKMERTFFDPKRLAVVSKHRAN